MIELVRSGRIPQELAKEFEPSVRPIRNWVTHDDRDAGRRAPVAAPSPDFASASKTIRRLTRMFHQGPGTMATDRRVWTPGGSARDSGSYGLAEAQVRARIAEPATG